MHYFSGRKAFYCNQNASEQTGRISRYVCHASCLLQYLDHNVSDEERWSVQMLTAARKYLLSKSIPNWELFKFLNAF